MVPRCFDTRIRGASRIGFMLLTRAIKSLPVMPTGASTTIRSSFGGILTTCSFIPGGNVRRPKRFLKGFHCLPESTEADDGIIDDIKDELDAIRYPVSGAEAALPVSWSASTPPPPPTLSPPSFSSGPFIARRRQGERAARSKHRNQPTRYANCKVTKSVKSGESGF